MGKKDYAFYIPKGVKYLDWNNALDALETCYEAGLYPLLIGPKGSGKTQAVRRFAELQGKPLFSLNLSLRTREHHLLGRLDMKGGEIYFKEGVVPKSMRAGGILYLDELNMAEADVLVRLDEVLDDRRELNVEGRVYKPREGWFVIATINPLTHVGTKELPPQINSRFPVKIPFSYPPPEKELEIIRLHVGECDAADIVRIAHKIRSTELEYVPSIRETIAAAKLVKLGRSLKEAVYLTMVEGYLQYGEVERSKVKELVDSMLGEEKPEPGEEITWFPA